MEHTVEMVFKVSFVVAVVLDLAIAAAVARHALRDGRREAQGRQPGGRPVLVPGEAYAAGGFFAAAMIAVTLAAHGWDALRAEDVVLFAAVLGIATAALLEQLRRRAAALALTAYAIPAAYGVLGGLAAPGL
ncbi:hypothetical protein [Streptomyces sp. ODS05-4]|uniref:hypothetical protein n=1 Tax=Streptomyces sp. ODS05-4 TaxID=2944939 RepID=UPI0021089588|nr:hypothetical protein [Streptomyces sp. ODS05-4]